MVHLKRNYIVGALLVLFFVLSMSFAQAALRFVPSSGIWFANPDVLSGEETKVYTAVINNVYQNANIIVTFFDNGNVIRSVTSTIGYEEARQLYTTWTPGSGDHEISVSLIVQEAVDLDGNPVDVTDLEAITLGRLTSTMIFVDADTDGDRIRDDLDLDDDNDGLFDEEEIQEGTDPLDPDTDDDGLADGEEVVEEGTDPLDPDTDGDGLQDGEEVASEVLPESEIENVVVETDPLDEDTDNDGLTDGEEVLETQTDPTDPDSDDDGTLDAEDAFPTDETETLDTDGDGIGNSVDPDDDGDGLTDEEEVLFGTDILREDTDKDNVPDGEEVEHGTDPLNVDSDGDGLFDGAEKRLGSDPLNPDTDSDGKTDGEDKTPLGSPPALSVLEWILRHWIILVIIVGMLSLGVFISTRNRE